MKILFPFIGYKLRSISQRKLKRIMILALALALIPLPSAIADSSIGELSFKDVRSSAWYYDEVKAVYEKGVMKGKSTDSFSPTDAMTRAEFVTVLYRLIGEDYEGFGNRLTFSDTKKDSWYSDAVAWGADIDLVKGLPDNRFGPSLYVSRQEVAVFIDRFTTTYSLNVALDPMIDAFKDSDEISDFAVFSAEIVRQNGIMGGDEKGYFKPKSNISRAEVATVVTRIMAAVDEYRQNESNSEVRVQKYFLYGEDDAPLPYRIYIPLDYTEEKKYPLLVFLHHNILQGSDNTHQLEAIVNLFENKESPVRDSIVIAPQCPWGEWWNGEPIDKVAQLVDIVNEKYSTDLSRQYFCGISMGGDGTFQMLLNYPEKVSAAMPVAGSGLTSVTDGNGNQIPTNINEEMLDIPILMIYDTKDEYVPGEYSRWMYNSLIEAGATNLIRRETGSYGHGICSYYVTADDISAIEWLYSQRRDVSALE